MQQSDINMPVDEILFPNGKPKAFTLSYDDGTVHDRRLVEIINRYGIRCTFNLNSGFLGKTFEIDGPNGKMERSMVSEAEAASLYAGHEIAGHGLCHASPLDIGTSAFLYEVIADKAALESVTGKPVRGYAYPFGAYDGNTKAILRQAGYKYARVVETTESFSLPADFLAWRGTCHHDHPDLMELAETFAREERHTLKRRKLFYVWGHSYEFAGNGNWERLERLCEYMKRLEQDVWFATNIDLYDYITAYRSLEYGARGSLVYNPSALPVWLRRGGNVYQIAPLETVTLG